jgi:hypothetical protein
VMKDMIEMKKVWRNLPNGVIAINGMKEKRDIVYIVESSGLGELKIIELMYQRV